MATYFHGNSEIQPDGLQTLYLMNPYVGYSDTSQPPTQPPNMAFLNSTGTPLNPANLSQSEQTQNHHFVGIPLQPIPTTPSSSSQHNPNPSSSSSQHEISTFHGFIPRVPYNLWSSIDHQITSPSVNNSVSATDYPTQLGLRRSSQQGLSLSLSPQPPAYGTYRSESDIPAPSSAPVISPAARGGDEMRASGGSSSSVVSANENSNTHSVLMGSKYLKVAQELLDEVVNVGKSIKNELSKENKKGETKNKEMNSYNGGEGSSTIGGDSSERKETELSTIERQEIQMKRAKLLTMLDEVEQRYTQYHQQMQIVVNSFEQSAGFSSAKSYTSLALQTISKQFRCLKDVILAQLRNTSKNLGEEDTLGGGKHRLVDHQLRQQRALQQLGMIQQNAWRPQRGLPERSVSTLRAWLFEHFLHPYPKDADKLMLAKQTGLTRSQVSNWFINARVRLWKPMVEEMYMEETKGQVQNGLEDESRKTKFHEELSSKRNENTLNEVDQTENPNTKQDKPLDSNIPRSTIDETIRTQSGFFLAGSSNGEEIVQRSAKKSRNTALQNSPSNDESVDMEMKPEETERKLHMNFGNERQNRDGYSFITDAASNGGEFGAYQQMDEIERFGPEQFAPPRFSNGVSLTLGLPHCENLSLSSTQQTYISNHNIQIGRQIEIGDANEAYENINIQNRKRFANQLLPDFVA